MRGPSVIQQSVLLSRMVIRGTMQIVVSMRPFPTNFVTKGTYGPFKDQHIQEHQLVCFPLHDELYFLVDAVQTVQKQLKFPLAMPPDDEPTAILIAEPTAVYLSDTKEPTTLVIYCPRVVYTECHARVVMCVSPVRSVLSPREQMPLMTRI